MVGPGLFCGGPGADAVGHSVQVLCNVETSVLEECLLYTIQYNSACGEGSRWNSLVCTLPHTLLQVEKGGLQDYYPVHMAPYELPFQLEGGYMTWPSGRSEALVTRFDALEPEHGRAPWPEPSHEADPSSWNLSKWDAFIWKESQKGEQSKIPRGAL